MSIIDLLEWNANQYGDEVALIEVNPEMEDIHEPSWRELTLVEPSHRITYRKTISWREFNELTNQLANSLVERGVKRNDKVAILMMNCIEWLPIYFGVLKAGAVVVPLNFRYSSEEIIYCLDLADVSVLLFGEEFVERVNAIQGRVSKLRLQLFTGDQCPSYAESYSEQISLCSKGAPDIFLTAQDNAAIYFSSGTTGFPKAILHNHESLMAACMTEQKHHSQSRDDIFLCIPPLYHTGAKMHWFGSLMAGSPAVLLRGVKPKDIIRTASKERVTILWLLVPWAQDILDAIDCGEIDLEEYDLSRLRLMHIGAQPVPPSLVKRWKCKFPKHEYDTSYGLTESIGPGAVHLGVENIHKVGAIGKAGYGWQVKIVDEKDALVRSGEVGELVLRGAGLMTCYYKDPDATKATIMNGWLHTGDMAREDEDGFIYLVDRKKDVIITGGENIYPVQIEDFLRSNNKIKDVAVIGLADYRLGEIAAAIIELKPGQECTQEEIQDFCKELPRYKRPRRVFFDKVPRNPTGKIEKPKLREKYCGGSVVSEQVSR